MNDRLEEARRKAERRRQIRATFKRRRNAGLKRRHERKNGPRPADQTEDQEQPQKGIIS